MKTPITIEAVRTLSGKRVQVNSVLEGKYSGVVVGTIDGSMVASMCKEVEPLCVVVALDAEHYAAEDWNIEFFMDELFDLEFIKKFDKCRVAPAHQVIFP